MARILFASEFCLLDRKSGAARSALAIMEALAAAGHDCHAFTLSLFDGSDEYPLPPEVDVAVGEVASFYSNGICQTVFRTASTSVKSIQSTEITPFIDLALDAVRRLEPDIVLTYGSAPLRPVLRLAQLMGSRTLFYLANASWADRDDAEIRFIDDFLVPSRALAERFCEKKAVAPERVHLLRDIIDPIAVKPKVSARTASRGSRTICLINPEPAKGGGFFLHLVAAAQRRAPDLRFRIVEGRWGRAQWEAAGAKIATLSNLQWTPTTQDMSSVYEQSALLLMPTLAFEASGRVILEAMQAGVPVLAMDRGGVAEQLDGGGFLFDCPAALIEKPLRAPPAAVVDQWLHFIQTLMRDDEIYARAVQLALAAASRADPHLRQREAVACIERLLVRPPVLASDAPDDVHDALIKMRAAMQEALDHPATLEGVHPYHEAISLSISQPAMREALAVLKDGRHEDARITIEAYLRGMPCDYQALLLLAELAAPKGGLAFAQILAKRAADLAPLAAEPRLILLRCLAAAKHGPRAQDLSEDLLDRFPDNAQIRALNERRIGGVQQGAAMPGTTYAARPAQISAGLREIGA